MHLLAGSRHFRIGFLLRRKDLTANKAATIVEDQNGDKCALIRVQTTQKGFHFDVGSLGVQKVEDQHPGEIWVYVPQGVRHIKYFTTNSELCLITISR